MVGEWSITRAYEEVTTKVVSISLSSSSKPGYISCAKPNKY